MYNKKFTLIELISSVVVIAILAAIVFATVGSLKNDSVRSAIASNVKGLQTASDRYKNEGNEDSIGVGVSTKENPKLVDLKKVVPKFIKKDPKVGKYWVDYNDVVWGSTINPPNISKSGDTYKWEEDKKADYYNAYELEKNSLKKVNDKPIKENDFLGEPNKEYLFTAVDKLDLETVPVGIGYEVVDSGDSEICTLKTDAGRYTAATVFTGKFVSRDVDYSKMIIDNDGNYVVIGQTTKNYIVDKYNKDLKFIGTIASDVVISGMVDLIETSNGDYIILTNDYSNSELIKFDKNLKFKDRKKINRSSSSEFLTVIEGDNDTYFVMELFESQQPRLIKFDKDLNELSYKEIALDGADISVTNLIPLSNGYTLLNVSTENRGVFKSRLIMFDQDMNIKKEYFLEDQETNVIENIVEDESGNIIALAGTDYSGYETPMLIKFDSELNLLKKAEIVHPRGYNIYNNLIQLDGVYTIFMNGYAQSFDSELNKVSEVDLRIFPETQGFIINDGNSYLLIPTDWRSKPGIYKYNSLENAMDNFIIESAPRVIHTLPPDKMDFRDLLYDIPYTDENNLNPPTGGSAPIAGSPKPTEKYRANYNDSMQSIDPIYAGSLIIKGELTSNTIPFFVDTDGTVRPLNFSSDNMDGPIFQLVPETDELWYYGGVSGPVPTGAIYIGLIETQTPTTGNGDTVDPCYAGSYMVKVLDMKLYKVNPDGTLNYVGDPFVMTPEEIGYDIWKDSLFYLYPNGTILDYPLLSEVTVIM